MAHTCDIGDGSRWRYCFQRQRERDQKRGRLLFSSIFLFSCSFALLKSSLLHSSLFSAPLIFKQMFPYIFPNRENVLRFPLFFFSQPSPCSSSVFFCFCFSFFSLFISYIPLSCSSLSPCIYKKEGGATTRVQSWHRGRRVAGRPLGSLSWAARRTCPLHIFVWW